MFDYTVLQQIKKGRFLEHYCRIMILLDDKDTLFLQFMVNPGDYDIYLCFLKFGCWIF